MTTWQGQLVSALQRAVSSAVIVAAACALGFFSPLAQAQETSLDLPRQWKFKKGDDPQWSEAAFDDKDWETIRVGKPWDRTYDGYGWYRLKLMVPKAWQSDELLQKHQHLNLLLGAIDDADQAWFNGQQVGQTGSLKGGNTRAHWNRSRTYQVPAGLVRWDKENVIAVRVHDQSGRGGLFRGPYQLAISNWTDLVQLRLGLGRGDGIFPANKPMEFTVTVKSQAPETISGRLDWTIQTDEKTDVHHESTNVTLITGKPQRIRCRFLPAQPGFYFARCAFVGEDGEVSQRMQLGYAPEKIVSPLTRERDFFEFWKQSREVLQQVEPRFEVIPQTK